MKTARRITIAAMLLATVAFAPAAWAQPDPAPAAGGAAAVEPVLKAIPDDALGFVLVKNITGFDEAVAKLAAAVQAPAPSVLSLFKAQSGIQEGLDENGSAAVALLPGKTADAAKSHPVPVLFLPITDYKKLIGQLQPDDVAAEITGVTVARHALVVGRKGSFAVFALPNQKEQLAKVLAATKGVDSLLGAGKPWIGRHQVSLVATPSGTKMAIEAALTGLEEARKAMKQFQNPNPPESSRAVKQQIAQVEMSLKMYETILSHAAKEVDAFAIGLSLDDHSNLSIDSHTKFVAGGSWSTSLKDIPSGPENPFACIRATSFIVAFEGLWPKSWRHATAVFSADSVSQMSQASGGAALDEQQRKKYIEATESMTSKLHSLLFIMMPPRRGLPILGGIVEVCKVDDAERFLGQYRKSIEQLGDVTNGLKNPPFRFSDVRKIEIDGHAGLGVTLDLSGVLAAQKEPAVARMMPLLFGSGGKLTMRMLVADKQTLVISTGDEESAKEDLAAIKNPPPSFASDVAATLNLLPPHAQWVGLVSVKGYRDFIGCIMAGTGVPFKLPELPTAPPVGFAAEADQHGVETQLVLPAATMAGISKAFRTGLQPHALPGRVLAPPIDPSGAAAQAMQLYDTNHDGVISGTELDKCPALKISLKRFSNGDGKVTAETIAAELQKIKDSKVGIMMLITHVKLDGANLEGATVLLDPEPFMGSSISPAKGVTSARGTASLMIDPNPQERNPQERAKHGANPGLYKVRITKQVNGRETIPARYNKDTELGVEVAQSNYNLPYDLRFDLKSR